MVEETGNRPKSDVAPDGALDAAEAAPAKPPLSPATRSLVIGASIVILLAGMRAASEILAPILLGFVLAIVIAPIIAWLQRRGMPRWLAWLAVAMVLIVVGLATIATIIGSVSDLAARLPDYQVSLAGRVAALEMGLAGIGIDTTQLRPLIDTNISSFAQTAASLVSMLISILYVVGLVIFLTVLFLLGAAGLSSRLWERPGDDVAGTGFFGEFSRGVQGNMLGLTANNFITAIAITIWLVAFRVDFAVLWGILAFFLGYIPNVGMLLAMLPPILLAFVQYGWETALIVRIGAIVIIGILNAVTNMFIGQGVDLSPATVFIAFIFWAWILGPLGTLLAFPLTVALKLALERNEGTRWVAASMSSQLFRQENRKKP